MRHNGCGTRRLLQLADDDRWARVAWSRLIEPGDGKVDALVREVGAGEALRALLERDVPWMARYRARVPDLHPERDVDQAVRLGGRVVLPGTLEWPAGLDRLRCPPLCLWVRGPADLGALADRSVAVVGARAATSYGEHVAGELAHGVASRGFTVVSGLAYGIDAAAHRGGLASAGSGVAFVAGGFDRPYPAGNDVLMQRLVQDGAVVSEVPPGCSPTKVRFLQRNRLIAAVSTGTVVVEAAVRSGSLNTARTAARLGRPVGAVPGPVTSSASAGCHALLRAQQAVLVSDADEVVDLLGRIGDDAAEAPHGTDRPEDDLDPVTRRVLDALPVRAGRPVDRLCATAGLDPATTQAALGRLDLLGLAERHGTGWRVVRPARPSREQRWNAANERQVERMAGVATDGARPGLGP
ncbi:DNA-processing protein DprA [Angustibacter aerolatus]